ncbi:MAG: outer membrane lipoprotein-sorting protein [Victivallales bacterium]|nr:outer membrane lipoprotein-sorting protein [Victivallales bacterium]
MVSKWYNRKEKLSRTLAWDLILVLDGKRLPTRMTLVPVDRKDQGYKTTMVYEEIDFDVALPPGTFSLSRLERQH